jgi:glutamine phosphoribosylpyrophosphate amidotransferase
MCGILGAWFSEKTPKNLEFAGKLMQQLKIRGTHAYGIYLEYGEGGVLCTHSNNFVAEEFLDAFCRHEGNCFIYHNRYSTSGDWQVMSNNQPILVLEDEKDEYSNSFGAIAMNGVLSQKTKEEYEKEFGVKCTTENDAEVFLRKMQQGVDIVDFLKQVPEASFAGVFLQKGKVFGVRNNKRPLYFYEMEGAQFLVSTIDTIRRAGGDITKVRIVKPFEVIWLGEGKKGN